MIFNMMDTDLADLLIKGSVNVFNMLKIAEKGKIEEVLSLLFFIDENKE